MLKKKDLDVSFAKLEEYDYILNQVDEPPKFVKVSWHPHELKRHPTHHHNGWRCDCIEDTDRCLSGMCDFYQGDILDPPIYGWRCNECDLDLCIRCLKADIYINNNLI